MLYVGIALGLIIFFLFRLYRWENAKNFFIWGYRFVSWLFRLTKGKRRVYSVTFVLFVAYGIATNYQYLSPSTFSLFTFLIAIGDHIITSEIEIVNYLTVFLTSPTFFASVWGLLSAIFVALLLFEWVDAIRTGVTHVLKQDASKSNSPDVWITTFVIFALAYVFWSLLFNFILGTRELTQPSDLYYLFPFYSIYDFIVSNLSSLIDKIPFVDSADIIHYANESSNTSLYEDVIV